MAAEPPASASGDGGGVIDPLLPDLVAVTLEESVESARDDARVILVGKHEVTIAGWEQCVAAGACDHRPRKRRYQGADHPVTGVNWRDARQYVQWLSELTGRGFRLPQGERVGLPGEGRRGAGGQEALGRSSPGVGRRLCQLRLARTESHPAGRPVQRKPAGDLRPRRQRLGVDRHLLAERRPGIIPGNHSKTAAVRESWPGRTRPTSPNSSVRCR